MPVEVQNNGHILKTMDAIDRNRVRTTGQQMGLCHQIKNGNTVAAALRGIAIICAPQQGAKRLSTANSLYFYELYGKDVEAIIAAMTSMQWKVAHFTAPLTMFHHGEPEQAREFARQIVTLEGLSSPVRVLEKILGGQLWQKELREDDATGRARHLGLPSQRAGVAVEGRR